MAEPVTDLDHARYDRDRWMDDAMKTQQKLIEISADLASERQTARLSAECHTREIRALQDMVEAEAEARREAEGEVERLRGLAEMPSPAMITAAWGAWRVRHKDKLGPGPAFVEAIRAAFAVAAPPPVPSSTKT